MRRAGTSDRRVEKHSDAGIRRNRQLDRVQHRLAGSLSNASLSEGQKLTVDIAKTGLGVSLPILIVQIEYIS
jgi:hypothetical protein